MKKRYKKLKWAQYILFGLSIVSCFLPIIISTCKAFPLTKTVESKLALGGATLFFCAVIALVVFRSLVTKFIHKLPYTLTVLVFVGVLLAFVMLIKMIADDAVAVLTTGLIGAAVGFIIELASMYCSILANEAREIYYRSANKEGRDDEAI